ncbi:MAG TPA: 5-oxoprolinase subunit PxpB [Acetomicrobium sp.]|uniref:5-oxoprolinase subunit PxpB n=1 Tax=Acetomicrobium sp. TaxID=1872099 RepID=UPI002B261E5C|nr:5-oxoprolinase subunit PxpB [Acetomicrobium sp.]HPT64852.1 5-oxoprolinase subunit PxpB [Acetomicrobium sp.]HXK99177.1 5-oxoprolinase subunit PxpB [Acetomicrobium sp.]
MAEYLEPKILYAGDSAVIVEFGDSIDMKTNAKVQQLRRSIECAQLGGIVEMVPTYRSLAVYFDPVEVEDVGPFFERLKILAQKTKGEISEGGLTIVIPVCYGGEFGPDMGNVVSHTGLTEEEIIRRHTAPDYYCYMLGFTPGFSYLGGMDETLATPRLKEPRKVIPAGSVGIAGKQTGIYPIESPGGWQLIGRTPLRLFDPEGEPPFLIDAGMWVRFRSIAKEEYDEIAAKVVAREYKPEIFPKSGDAE